MVPGPHYWLIDSFQFARPPPANQFPFSLGRLQNLISARLPIMEPGPDDDDEIASDKTNNHVIGELAYAGALKRDCSQSTCGVVH